MPSAFFDSQNKKKADDLKKKETRTNVKNTEQLRSCNRMIPSGDTCPAR